MGALRPKRRRQGAPRRHTPGGVESPVVPGINKGNNSVRDTWRLLQAWVAKDDTEFEEAFPMTDDFEDVMRNLILLCPPERLKPSPLHPNRRSTKSEPASGLVWRNGPTRQPRR